MQSFALCCLSYSQNNSPPSLSLHMILLHSFSNPHKSLDILWNTNRNPQISEDWIPFQQFSLRTSVISLFPLTLQKESGLSKIPDAATCFYVSLFLGFLTLFVFLLLSFSFFLISFPRFPFSKTVLTRQSKSRQTPRTCMCCRTPRALLLRRLFCKS